MAALLLGACSNETTENPTIEKTPDSTIEETVDDEMVHDESADIPKDLKEAENSTYQIGDTVEIKTDHMGGMNGAEVTIVGAFNTSRSR